MPLPSQASPPDFALTDAAPSRVVGATLVAVPVLAGADGLELGPGSVELVEDLGLDAAALLDDSAGLGVSSAPGSIATLPLVTEALRHPALRSVLLVGVGTGTPGECRRAGAALARRAAGQESVATSIPAVGDDECLTAFVEGAVLGSFRFTMRSSGQQPAPVRRVVIAVAPSDDATLRRALALAGAGWMSRTLATVPSNVKTPAWLADQAVLAGRAAGLQTKVWDERELVAQGFGGIVGVGQGSAHPPRFVRLDYVPASGARRAPHVVLVGKGITFDTGGLSIKPGEGMVNMKRDMTGAGIVLAVMAALGDLECPVRVTGLLCIAENSIGADAMRPGDVLTQYGGRTTEVVNTDAEGRLVLADGMAYAVEQLKPDVLVDVATLTGAVKVALGVQTGGLFANDEALATALTDAGAASGEPLWRLPLVSEYEPLLASPVADAINSPEMAKSVTAALFLQHFNGALPWAHLDLASVGDSPGERDEWTTGPTGFGARLLLRWLTSSAPLAGVGEER